MKSLRLLVIALFAGAACAFAADTQTPATTTPTVEKPACCVRAEKKGKTCEKPCCVAAAKEGKACEKCLKKGHGKKKDGAGEEHKGHKKPAPEMTPEAAPATTPATTEKAP